MPSATAAAAGYRARTTSTTLFSETWTGTNGATWPAAWTTSSNVTIQSNQGRLVTLTGAYQEEWGYRSGFADGNFLMKFQIGGTTERYFAVQFRKADSSNYYQLAVYPTAGLQLDKKVAGATTTLASPTPITWSGSTFYWLRIIANGTSLSATAWADGGSEPGSPQISVTDSAFSAAGLLELHVINGATSGACTFLVDDLTVTTISSSGGGGGGSGQSMPTGNVVSNGITWVPAKSEDFTTAAALGAVRAAYPDINFTPEGGGGGKYLADQTVTVANSILDVFVHHIGAVDAGAQMYILESLAGNWAWVGGRFAVRFRADASAAGYGAAFQLWPLSNVWAEGEMDFPEGDFGGNINFYHHQVGANPEVNFASADSGVDWTGWHTAVIEWVPGTSARYYLDGSLVGQVTTAAQVATTEHYWAIQTAAHDQTVNGASDSAQGHLQIDWYVVYQAA